jgi:Bacterial extracellular solute-binding protein
VGNPRLRLRGLLYYRKDLLAAVGRDQPPSTWRELVKIAQEVHKKYPKVDGYAGQYDRYEGLVLNVFEAVWAHGGELVSTDGTSAKVTVDSPQAKAGLQCMVNVGKIAPDRAQSFKEEDGNAYLRPLEQAMENARPRPLTEHYADISQAVSTEVYKLLFNDQPLELTINALRDKLDRILGTTSPPGRRDSSGFDVDVCKSAE